MTAAAGLRFEAIYFGLLSGLAVAVLLVRFDWEARDAGVGLLVAAATGALWFLLSVRRGGPERPPRERSQRMLPVILLLALLAMAAERTAAGVAGCALAGLAAGALAGLLVLRGRPAL